MVTKSLADITNMSKAAEKEKSVNQLLNVGENQALEESVEANMRVNLTNRSALPLVDSFIDNGNEPSKRLEDETMAMMENGLNEQHRLIGANDLDEFDQFGGPASIFNTNANLEDMLLDEYPAQINLEVTPTKGDEAKNIKKIGSDEEEYEDDDENLTNVDGVKKSKSQNTTKQKRHYRRSQANVTGNKENTKDDFDETIFEDAQATDPTKNLNKRAKTMMSILNKGFNKNDNVGFFELIKRNSRKHVAQKFYSLLVLKKYEIIDVSQDEHYGDIIICKGEKFDEFASN
jgi:chromatin segregation and condensation protein Rec8/ScpA/Scc1 (kleisin family)